MDRQTKSEQLRSRNRNPSLAKKIAQSSTEDTSGDEHEQLETIWIKIECRPKNIAI